MPVCESRAKPIAKEISMKPIILPLLVLALCSNAFAEHAKHWTYDGAEGPENWARLAPEFATCAGKNQSPINLSGFVNADLKPISFTYKAAGEEIINNGHTVQVNFGQGSNFELDGTQFNLKQFHFHAPSENHINGTAYPMEVHLVHADKNGNLAVIAVMLSEGKENPSLKNAWAKMPGKSGDKNALSAAVRAEDLLPANRDYYRFTGSLTTPPCTEGVLWLVMKEPVSVSHEQIKAFTDVISHPNNRPLQLVNARAVLE
jgi:carbonic anhydrase